MQTLAQFDWLINRPLYLRNVCSMAGSSGMRKKGLFSTGGSGIATTSKSLAGLSPNQREAFVLIRYEGMSVEEAAAILGISEGAVKLRAFNAYEALRKALGDAAPKKATHASKAAKRAAGGDA